MHLGLDGITSPTSRTVHRAPEPHRQPGHRDAGSPSYGTAAFTLFVRLLSFSVAGWPDGLVLLVAPFGPLSWQGESVNIG